MRVLVRDFFVLCCCVDPFEVFSMEFCGFGGRQGFHRVPNGSLLVTLRDQISAQLGALVASWFQSGSQIPKRWHLGSVWHVLGVFWCMLCAIVYTKCNGFAQECGEFSLYFSVQIVSIFLTTLFSNCVSLCLCLYTL